MSRSNRVSNIDAVVRDTAQEQDHESMFMSSTTRPLRRVTKAMWRSAVWSGAW